LNHRPRKRFSQNFLRDSVTIQRIIQAIDPLVDDNLVEIGPGQGAITTGLLPKVKRMHAVEIDRDLLEPLARRCHPFGELTIHNTDALKFDFAQLSSRKRPLRVVGNLPYNISTPLLFHLLNYSDQIRDMHLMLQKEVVARMAASPGSKSYSRLSVMLQAKTKVTPLFYIDPEAFHPSPKVDSAFVRLQPYHPPPYQIHDARRFHVIVRQAFTQRRKTLRNCLRDIISAEAIQALGLDPASRPEQLSVADFVLLANQAEQPNISN
jgi:16S rRNA (adenine1518-N6/adenine1519-N6)-dimethyltransferase